MKIRNLFPTIIIASTPLITLSSCSNTITINNVIANTQGEKNLAYQIIDAIKFKNKECNLQDELNPKNSVILDVNKKEIIELVKNLTDEQYQIKSVDSNILIAARTGIARAYAVDHLLTEYLTDDGLVVPTNLDIKGNCKPSDYVTELYSNIRSTVSLSDKYRDPYIYREGNDYYMVATATLKDSEKVGDDWWHLWKADGEFNNPNTKWNDLGYIIDSTNLHANLIKGDKWAPELYKYKNPDTGREQYYIFTTFATKENSTNEPARGRGCAVFRSDKLVDDNGKACQFELISYYGGKTNLGRITNPEQSCIDGHLYIDDKTNTPYMVFVQEFTDFTPQNGRMFVAQMSNDLTHFETEAKEIFKATDAPWVSQATIQTGQFRVTDGPFIYKLSSGKLMMLWSSYYDEWSKQYCMGYATADNILGPWEQNPRLMYDEFLLDGYTTEIEGFSLQGGHGMIFTNTQGKMYMCIHCGAWDKHEHPFIFPIKEAYGTLVLDLYKK